MSHPLKIQAIVIAAFLSHSAASAEDMRPANTAVVRQEHFGVTRLASVDGFALVTLRSWSTPMRTVQGSRASLNAEQAQRLRATHAIRDNVFRRAIYLTHVREAERAFNLPVGLLDALVWTESRYNPLAISKAGAAGLGQLMPGTAQTLGVRNRFDPHANLHASAQYLRQMLDKFGAIYLAVAAYNAGPAAVQAAGGIPRNTETLGYVRRVLETWRAFSS